MVVFTRAHTKRNQIVHGDETQCEADCYRIESTTTKILWWHGCWRAICLR